MRGLVPEEANSPALSALHLRVAVLCRLKYDFK